MSNENKTVELKDKHLKKVHGGGPDGRPGGNTIEELYGTPLGIGRGYIEYLDCKECLHYIRPEGPCE